MANEQQPEVPAHAGPREAFTPWTIGKLADDLNPSRVALDPRGNPYLEGWDVIAAANHYFGFGGWVSEVLSLEAGSRFQAERGQGNQRHMADLYVYTARVRVTAGGVSHEDVGTGVTATDTPEAHETAIKGATTDALKRALRQYGAQFGNDLYDKGRTGDMAPPQEAPQRTAPAPAQTAAPDVLTWAWKAHKVNKTQAMEICGVSTLEEFKALGGEAQTRIEKHLDAKENG